MRPRPSARLTEAKAATITIALPSLEEQYVDPHFAVGGLIFPLTWAISETLYAQNAAGAYVPNLATGYTLSDDSLTWTFKLRDDVKMQDGSLFTATDVKTAIDRIVGSAEFTWYATFKSVRHRRHRGRSHDGADRHEQAVRHDGRGHAASHPHRVLQQRG